MGRAATTELNKKEKAVLDSFDGSQKITISELAAKAFPKKGTSAQTKGNSWVRNSLRKLLRLKLVEHISSEAKGGKSGVYRRTRKKSPEAEASVEA